MCPIVCGEVETMLVETPGQWQSAPAVNSAVHYLQTIATSITLSMSSEKGARHLIKARFHEMVGETVRYLQTSLAYMFVCEADL